MLYLSSSFFFFFNDTATTEIYTLSLHDALPISIVEVLAKAAGAGLLHEIAVGAGDDAHVDALHLSGSDRLDLALDRKSTRLNSSHDQISYAVFCLKKKKCTPTVLIHLPYRHVHS